MSSSFANVGILTTIFLESIVIVVQLTAIGSVQADHSPGIALIYESDKKKSLSPVGAKATIPISP